MIAGHYYCGAQSVVAIHQDGCSDPVNGFRKEYLLPRFVALLFSPLFLILLVQDAMAQSNLCEGLLSSLAKIENTNDYRNLRSAKTRIVSRQNTLKRSERSFAQMGCLAAQLKKQPLNPSCRRAASQIRGLEAAVQQAEREFSQGSELNFSREKILQQMARFNCSSRSSVTVRRNSNQPRKNLFDFLFGNDDVYEEPELDWRFMDTKRSLCVRECDGYYWPISFSAQVYTLPDDLAMCQQQCPGATVDLYYHDNPGGSPAQAVSLDGKNYTDLPNAFAYRKSRDNSCGCGSRTNVGIVELLGDIAFVKIGEISIPLPRRDPRFAPRVVEVVLVDIPLPLRRPDPDADPAETQLVVVKPDLRIITQGDKTIRLVGPDTPYIPKQEEPS